ncbi:hypothetical protein [Actinacidiphila bryophytorum]|uniref:Uncharacterized protein n=1 Tax=Actinacidiphila bryophytorum TaxID=1436133 RepID=A0A9W4H8U0_9ACTN|nr:hypothetical protein [Actinacidiphila bryophytorum]MBM9440231.1 hypothetical protein [Actinacidiphila bryophytorum]MBN6545578.1 hypothetical protein [Actinacidiphila bryophytorum]CAG7658384.1 conserved hypothetical protein [Actinacidiphila bryophytorum]
MNDRPEPGAPGSVRHSLVLLAAVGAVTVTLLGLAEGLPGLATGLAVCTVAGLAIARYVTGAGTQDSGFRRSVRLLGSRAPALGEWHRVVDKSIGDRSDVHFNATLRPQLQRLFAARLAERHGVDLYRRPERAKALVGADLWPWIDPERRPAHRPDHPERVLRALLDRLEAL